MFVDFHHASLLQSLILLFEKRFSSRVYRPIGLEWANKGFWAVYNHPATQLQYLTTDQGYRPIDGTRPLNTIIDSAYIHETDKDPGVYFCQDIDSGKYNRAITYEAFQKMHFSIVIASLPQHIEPYKKLSQSHWAKPRFIYQIGNAWDVPSSTFVPNVMSSAVITQREGIPHVTYHQEFDTQIFYADPVDVWKEKRNGIYSFVNCFSVADYMREDYNLFQEVEKRMSDFSFRAYGGQCRDGAAHGTVNLANTMRSSRFIWHTKAGGDGYGHVIHNAAAVARPAIVKKLYYQGKLAENLMIDGETCIAIDGLDYDQIVNKIRYYDDPTRYAKMTYAIAENFSRVVDFDKEAEILSQFIDNLL